MTFLISLSISLLCYSTTHAYMVVCDTHRVCSVHAYGMCVGLFFTPSSIDICTKIIYFQIFCPNSGDRSRGAAILIRKCVPFTPISVVADNNGHFKLFGSLFVLVHFHGPNWDNPQFLSRLIGKHPILNSLLPVLGENSQLTGKKKELAELTQQILDVDKRLVHESTP